MTPYLRGIPSDREGSDQDGRQSAGSVESISGDEAAKPSLAILFSSDDRLELTLSPGTMETILKLVEVHMYLS